MRYRTNFAALALAIALAGCAGTIRDWIYRPATLAETTVSFAGEAPQTVTARTADGLDLAGYH